MAKAAKKTPETAAQEPNDALQGAANAGPVPSTETAAQAPAAELAKPEGKKEETALPKPAATAPAKHVSVKKFQGSIAPFRQEIVRQTYVITPDDGHTPDDVLNPAYWANVTAQLEPTFRIEVLFTGADPRWMDLLVVAKGNVWAQVKVLANVSLADEAQAALGLRLQEAIADFKVYHKGGAQKWVVERIKDKAILSSGHVQERDALKWVEDYQKTLRR